MAIGYVKILFEVLDIIQNLSKEDQGKILHGIVTYSMTGIIPELNEKCKTIWPMIESVIQYEAEYDAKKTEYEANETEGKANESESNRNDQVYVYGDGYGYFSDDDLRVYAHQAHVNECYMHYIGHVPTPGEVGELVTYAHHYKFEPAVLEFAIQKSAHAKNPVRYALEMLNRWELRDIKTLVRAVEAFKNRECKTEEGRSGELPF